MLSVLVPVAVIAVLFLGLVGLLFAVTRWQRGRDRCVAQQIAVTDAIHRELGAVVAPSMVRTAWGSPRLVIPIPLERTNLVAAVLAIAHRVLENWDGGAPAGLEIVVVPRPDASPLAARRAA